MYGNKIRELREEKGLTQAELAKELNVVRQTIAQWENEERDLKTGAIISLARYFNVTSDYILGLEDCRTHEAAEISKQLGLSEKNIEQLRYLCDVTSIHTPVKITGEELLKKISHFRDIYDVKCIGAFHDFESYLKEYDGVSMEEFSNYVIKRFSDNREELRKSDTYIINSAIDYIFFKSSILKDLKQLTEQCSTINIAINKMIESKQRELNEVVEIQDLKYTSIAIYIKIIRQFEDYVKSLTGYTDEQNIVSSIFNCNENKDNSLNGLNETFLKVIEERRNLVNYIFNEASKCNESEKN